MLQWKRISATTGILILTAFTGFWAYWGITENFHEGWYYPSLLANIKLLVVQYLSHMFVFLTLGWVGIYFSKTGSLLIFITGIILGAFFNNKILLLPFIPAALLLYLGELKNKKKILCFHILFPVVILLIFSIEPLIRVQGRDKKIYNGAHTTFIRKRPLTWAPQGPGWPELSFSWLEADSISRHLADDGKSLLSVPQFCWRLPTLEEAVASMQRKGKQVDGRWDTIRQKAIYRIKPDKEPPLWRVYSPIIYWWTSSSPKEGYAYLISANGVVKSQRKDRSAGYYSFRAVK